MATGNPIDLTRGEQFDPLLNAVSHLDAFGYEATDRARWKADPVAWARERAHVEPWSKQREILEAVRDHPKTAVRSCHSAGKSFNAAVLTAWWIDAHPPGTAFVITTAPTGAQVKSILWREINRLHERANLGGNTNLTEWYLGGELVAFGRKPADHSNSAFQGIHALYVLVILDEACGIPADLWVAGETIASNRHSRMLAIGNPDDSDGEFARVCDPTSGWHKIKISYLDTPNFTHEPVSDNLRDMLIAPDWVEDKKIHWGENSALFQSKCLGEFPKPELDPWTVVQLGSVMKCRYLDLPDEDQFTVEAGIDVGAGGDRTVIRERRGTKVGREKSFQDADPMATMGQLVECLAEWGVNRVKIDVIGIGWGIYGRLKELSSVQNPGGECRHGAEVVPVNFASKSVQPKRFLNLRAEVWWQVGRELSRNGGWDLGALDDDVIGELTTPRYEIMDSYGKIKIEPKDKVRERLGASPDRAEALLLAFYDGAGGRPPDTSAVDTFRRAQLGGGTSTTSPFQLGVPVPGRGAGVFGGHRLG